MTIVVPALSYNPEPAYERSPPIPPPRLRSRETTLDSVTLV
jgi:hypothetical protein